MNLDLVLGCLHYDSSPNFLTGPALDADRDFGHVFRKARRDCDLQGVYVLNGSAFDKSRSSVPVVYVCRAASESEAREIHRKVWNQNAVPFLLVATPTSIRLYPGFRYDPKPSDSLQGAIAAVSSFNEIAELAALAAPSIDSAEVWTAFGSTFPPEKRVDWKLLHNLTQLAVELGRDGQADRRLTHAMIGKFVYIHYLRQRDILSDRRLGEWGIAPSAIFGASAELEAFTNLVARLDDYLNGSVFPVSSDQIRAFGLAKLRDVSAAFQGETPGTRQLPLFDLYDFSFIPIETLSVIYEQFLHDAPDGDTKSPGEERAAYYTPIPVVNYMLDRLDAKKPLVPGMRVLDPSCGSGAFLVQCYRKLIEGSLRNLRRRLFPEELGRLLTDHIFGVDIDEDACQIAELSLALTLLEYIDPPDLTDTNFKLPSLRGRNIFSENAFDDHSHWIAATKTRKFDWVVGNPPWKDLVPSRLDKVDSLAWSWMLENHSSHPVGGNQLAEAFAWRATEVLASSGEASLLLPAMTLFKYESKDFRAKFFSCHRTWSVANFANLSNILFRDRAKTPTTPAAAIFFSNVGQPFLSAADFQSAVTVPIGAPARDLLDDSVEVFSPHVATQLSTLKTASSRRDAGVIVVNSSDIRSIPYREVITGDPLSWKLAMWGSSLDRRILETVGRRFETVGSLAEQGTLILSQGLELRPANNTDTTIEIHPELIGCQTLKVQPLKNRRFLIRFPPTAISQVEASACGVRKRGGFNLPFSVCQPPHVIVGVSRSFAVYSEETLIVPSRRIGIASPSSDRALLKAIALYLNSDFATYYEFLTTTQAGIQMSISTLAALRLLPIPFSSSDLTPWLDLYAHLEHEARQTGHFDRPDLIDKLNDLTFDALRLSSRARASVTDLVRIRLSMTRGKPTGAAVEKPIPNELLHYAQTLCDELDAFVGATSGIFHTVEVLHASGSGLIAVELHTDALPGTTRPSTPARIVPASDQEHAVLEQARSRLVTQHGQWLYFNRNLRVYDGNRTYILKPLQRLQWTRTQAILDANEIIADSLRPQAPDSPETVHSEAIH